MENKLRTLYLLQLVDSHLDELEELKGDLPSEVRGLEAEQAGLNARLAERDNAMRTAFVQRDAADSDIIETKAKLEKYKKQQYAVRSNREYDALTREMDAATEGIAKLEREMETLEGSATAARQDIETLKVQLSALDDQVKEKKAALAEVSKATEDEELKYQHERQKLVARLHKADLTTYERIRKAKKGKAIVPVKRGACGGCFNRVPPQRLLELRRNDRFHTCERCGRILVSDEIAAAKISIA